MLEKKQRLCSKRSVRAVRLQADGTRRRVLQATKEARVDCRQSEGHCRRQKLTSATGLGGIWRTTSGMWRTKAATVLKVRATAMERLLHWGTLWG